MPSIKNVNGTIDNQLVCFGYSDKIYNLLLVLI